jgi:arylsulfatase A-like enzyme
MLAEAGYRTHVAGKNHFGDFKHGYESLDLEEAWRGQKGRDFRCDYRKWFEKHHPDKDVDATGLGYNDHLGIPWPYDESLHPTNWTARKAIEFLKNYKGEEPWFLKVSFKRPHPPFDPPKRLIDYYESIDLPKAQVGAWAEKEHGVERAKLEESRKAIRVKYSDEDIRSSRAAYYASITHVDEQIGEVLKALKNRGEFENTLIVFLSDHGDMMGDNNLWHKTYAYEGSSHIPIIVRWPKGMRDVKGARRGSTIDSLVELRDVLPTFLDAADVEKPKAMDGMSLLPLIAGEEENWREILGMEHSQCYWEENAWVALTDGRWKYIYFTPTGKQQMFDLQSDPYETIDLAKNAKFSEKLRSWRVKMVDYLSERGEPWVKDGDLAIQTEPVRYAPHHPIILEE